MQGEYVEELDISGEEYHSVLGEVIESDSNDYSEIPNETSEVNLENLFTELEEIEITDENLLTQNNLDFFDLSDDDLEDDVNQISDSELYVNPSFVSGNKSSTKNAKGDLTVLLSDTIKATSSSLQGILSSLSSIPGLSNINYEEMSEVKNYVNSIDSKSPFFVNSTIQNEVFHYIQKDDCSAEDIFNLCSLKEVDKKNEAKKITFINWVNKLKEENLNFRKALAHYTKIGDKAKTILLVDMFKGLDIKERFGALQSTDKRNILTDFYTDGDRVTHFKCNSCSTESDLHLVPLHHDFLVITNINSKQNFLSMPAVCDRCGTLHVLNPKTFASIARKCETIGSKLSAGNKSSSGLKVATYIPGSLEVSNLLSLYHDIHFLPNIDMGREEHVDEVDNTISVDWEAIRKDFRDLNVMIGDSLFKIAKPGESLHNSAKILANQINIYPRLKENALASLILTLEKDGLYSYSLTTKTYYNVYSKINNLDNVTPTALKNLSEIFTYNLVNDDGSINKELFKDVFDKIRENNKSFEQDKSLYLDNVSKNKYLLSYVPISSVELREDMIYNYLSDSHIASLLDEISDLMILNHLAEEIFSSLSVPEVKDPSAKIVSNRKFQNIKQSIISVNRKKPLAEYIDKLSSGYFGVPSKTVVKFVSTGDAMNNLANFLESCYRGDLYDMHKYYSKMNLWDASECEDCIKELFEFITIFPVEKLTTDKFGFYFDFECETVYKARFVKLYERKGFVPKVMKGDTLDEKLDYYSKCTVYDAKDIMPARIKQLLENYRYVISFGRFLSYSGMYRDFGAYYAMRDVLYQSQKFSLDKLLTALSLDSTVASLLIEDDYTYPSLDPSIIKDFIYLVLPIFDGDLEDIQTDMTKSFRDRINSVIGEVETLIAEYKDLDGLNELINDLIKDLGERKGVQ